MSGFYAGQKVVCVDAATKPGHRWEQWGSPLVQDRIYTIVNVFNCNCGHTHIDIGNRSVPGTECPCGYRTRDGVWWFYPTRFRPLDELTGDLKHCIEEIEEGIEEQELVLVEP